MAEHERGSMSDEWYTPKWVFDALGCEFDLDVASPGLNKCHVPAKALLTKDDDALAREWEGFVWMNPPYGKRNGVMPWVSKFIRHGNGIALLPNRTACGWWQATALWADVVFFVKGKIKFERPDGSVGKSPGYGNVLIGRGPLATRVLERGPMDGLIWHRS